MKEVKAKPLSLEAFEKYGAYASMNNPDGVKLGADPIEFYRDRIQSSSGRDNAVSFSPLRVMKRDNVVNVGEYHNYCNETVLPLDGDVIIFVAPAVPGNDFPTDEVEAFLVPKGTLVTVKPGVWHHAPFSVDGNQVNCVVILPERTYQNDCAVVELNPDQQVRINS